MALLNSTKVLKSFEKHKLLWSHSSVFALTNSVKSAHFWTFLLPQGALVVTFNETRAITSKKYIAEQGIDIPKVLQKQIALVALLRFYVRIIASKMLFGRFFISKKTFNVQWNACTYFQKICSWTRYESSKILWET